LKDYYIDEIVKILYKYDIVNTALAEELVKYLDEEVDNIKYDSYGDDL